MLAALTPAVIQPRLPQARAVYASVLLIELTGRRRQQQQQQRNKETGLEKTNQMLRGGRKKKEETR